MSPAPLPTTPEQWAKAEALRKTGATWNRISTLTGITVHRLKSAMIDGYAELRAAQNRANRSEREGRVIEAKEMQRADEIERIIARIPPDTRTLEQRFMGDPPRWRSALGQREGTR